MTSIGCQDTAPMTAGWKTKTAAFQPIAARPPLSLGGRFLGGGREPPPLDREMQ
jgi:hypothetical protein